MPLPAEFFDLAARVNNWGRWGEDDEKGTWNLLTPERARAAAALVREGRSFSLGLPLSEGGPQSGAIPGRINPLRAMTAVNEPLLGDPELFCSSDDVVTMALQGATHWDALAHVSYAGRIYNGFGADTVSARGAARCGIDKVPPVVGRGVLLDLARARGQEALEGGRVVTADDLDAAAEMARVSLEPGDMVLLRTGHLGRFKEGNRSAYAAPSPGPSLEAVEWFHRHDLAAVATDTLTFEVFPPERADMVLPVHLLDLVEMGMSQGQNWDLDALAEDCANDGRYAFLLQATPEPFRGGLGGPVNPVALK